jgi:outer membrane receptor protein involved in Fe transport
MRGFLFAGVSAAALIVAPAWAEDADPQAGGGQQTAQAGSAGAATADAGDFIIVTGSRIRRLEFDTLEPVAVTSQEYIDARGLTNVADALLRQPGFGAAVTPEGGQSSFGVSQNFVNQFGLGTARTLTVINGRRTVSSNAPSIFGPAAPGVQVDLNIIPQNMVERIESISIGGAPTYGSDAIAGTVNIILKRDFEGIELRALTGITSRGDAFRYNLGALLGHNFGDGRGNITFGIQFDSVDGVPALARPRTQAGFAPRVNPTAANIASFDPTRTPGTDGRVNPNVPFNTGPADGIPNAVYIANDRFFTFTANGLLFPATGGFNLNALGTLRGFGPDQRTYLQFDGNGRLAPYNPGTPFGTVNASGGDGFNLTETAPLSNDLERVSAALNFRYDINDNFRVFFEGNFYSADALEILDQAAFNVNLFGGVSAPLIFSVNDPRLHPDDRALLQGLGVTDFRMSRIMRDLQNNRASSKSELWRGVVGFSGDFNIGEAPFFWEVSANWGRSEGRFFGNSIIQQNFVNAVNVRLDAAGNLVCDPTPARNVAPGGIAPRPDPACVPLQVFGENRNSDAVLAYVSEETESRALLQQEVYTAVLGGTPFRLWAGDVSFVAGFEHRVERGKFIPAEALQTGRGRSALINPNRGSFNTKEVFGELVIPITSPDNNIPLLHSLSAEGKIRYVYNTVNGGFTTWTAGGRWRPVRDIEFRGNYTRSLRAPALVELFTPQSQAFSTVPDPCDTRNVNSGARPEVRQRNCQAFYQFYGLDPDNFQSIAVSATVPIVTGGDPNLLNEQGNAWTVGVVLRPRFLPGFRAQVDWNDIKIIGPIANLNTAQIATGCFDNDNFDTSDVPNANQFCSRIRRNPDGQISADVQNPGVRTGFVNGQEIRFQGLTADVGYSFPVRGFGDFDISGRLFYLEKLETNINGVVPAPSHGTINDPQWRATGILSFTRGNFLFDFEGRFTDKIKLGFFDNVETRDIIVFDQHWLFNTSLAYRFNEGTIMRFSVTNLFDAEPPFPLGGAGTYDTLGRRYALSLRYTF